jgi:hypothetical protein
MLSNGSHLHASANKRWHWASKRVSKRISRLQVSYCVSLGSEVAQDKVHNLILTQRMDGTVNDRWFSLKWFWLLYGIVSVFAPCFKEYHSLCIPNSPARWHVLQEERIKQRVFDMRTTLVVYQQERHSWSFYKNYTCRYIRSSTAPSSHLQ